MIEIDLPEDWASSAFRLRSMTAGHVTRPARSIGRMAEAEWREADALCELVEMLTLLKLRAQRALRKSRSE